MRQGKIMNAAKSIPFSRLLLPNEARDCPICLEAFKEDSEVVQLKCSKFHIYHHKCLNDYLEI